MELYRDRLWSAWLTVDSPTMTDIPVAKAQLMGRANDFDGGRTAAWMSGLKSPTWRAVRDAHSGHSIHVVSDRPFAALTHDLASGLRLLNWMSQRPVVWYWWDHDWPRILPANVVPQQEHLNGGWAIPGVPEVHVYRREEAHKVLLHESIHALGLDVPVGSIEPIRRQFESVLGRQLWPHLGEAFTELYAEWLWAIAGAKTKKEAVERWQAQLKCSERQAGEIWARICDITMDEDTNVFAYYVLKWVLMQHLDIVLVAPSASVTLWFVWWMDARPILDEMGVAAADSKQSAIAMGMTCG